MYHYVKTEVGDKVLESKLLYKNSLEYFKERLSHNLGDGKNDLFTKRIMCILKVLDGYNTYLILSSGYEKRVWNDLIRSSNNIEKFIIEETGLFIRNCLNDEDELYNLINLVALSFSTLGGSSSILDSTLLNKLPSRDEAITMIVDNLWLLTLILIKDTVDEKIK